MALDLDFVWMFANENPITYFFILLFGVPLVFVAIIVHYLGPVFCPCCRW